jgi:pantothenate kinase
MSRRGDVTNVDLLVSDIYGKGFVKDLGLAEDLIASSFGKVEG